MSVINKVQYETLSTNLGDQYAKFEEIGTLANDALIYVVQLNEVDPEIDMLFDFYPHSLKFGTSRINEFRQVVTSLQSHVINRSGLSLNDYLTANAIMVTQDFADLSSGLGFPIDPSHITP
jgi:hypothetical protein